MADRISPTRTTAREDELFESILHGPRVRPDVPRATSQDLKDLALILADIVVGGPGRFVLGSQVPGESSVEALNTLGRSAREAFDRQRIDFGKELLLAMALPGGPRGPRRPRYSVPEVHRSTQERLREIERALREAPTSETASTPDQIADLLEELMAARRGVTGGAVGLQSSEQVDPFVSNLVDMASSEMMRRDVPLREGGMTLSQLLQEGGDLTGRIAEDVRLRDLIDQLRSGEISRVAPVVKREAREAMPRERGRSVTGTRLEGEEPTEAARRRAAIQAEAARLRTQIGDARLRSLAEDALLGDVQFEIEGGSIRPIRAGLFPDIANNIADVLVGGSADDAMRFLETPLADMTPTAIRSLGDHIFDAVEFSDPEQLSQLILRLDAYPSTNAAVLASKLESVAARSFNQLSQSTQLGSLAAANMIARLGPQDTSLGPILRDSFDPTQFNRALQSRQHRSLALRQLQVLRERGIDPESLGIARTVE